MLYVVLLALPILLLSLVVYTSFRHTSFRDTPFSVLSEKVPGPNNSPVFSLIFLIKNSEEDLEWFVRRLMLLQFGKYDPFEVILVDRGSADRTPQIAALLDRDYPMVKALMSGRGLFNFWDAVRDSASGRVLLMEDLHKIEDYGPVIKRIKRILKQRQCAVWDQSPTKIETRGEYNNNRQDDTM